MIYLQRKVNMTVFVTLNISLFPGPETENTLFFFFFLRDFHSFDDCKTNIYLFFQSQNSLRSSKISETPFTVFKNPHTRLQFSKT